jgi:hypothetical protein
MGMLWMTNLSLLPGTSHDNELTGDSLHLANEFDCAIWNQVLDHMAASNDIVALI